jgi:nucleoside 2-deoxyribosyltransferase
VKVYVAGPLFNDMERERNLEVERWLRRLGFDVHLPQKHGLLEEPANGRAAHSARGKTFESDVAALRACDAVLCLLDGPVPDDGMCVELGIAWALGKPCVGYRTDMRLHGPTGPINPMIEGCLIGIAGTRAELGALLRRAALKATGIARSGIHSRGARGGFRGVRRSTPLLLNEAAGRSGGGRTRRRGPRRKRAGGHRRSAPRRR